MAAQRGQDGRDAALLTSLLDKSLKFRTASVHEACSSILALNTCNYEEFDSNDD